MVIRRLTSLLLVLCAGQALPAQSPRRTPALDVGIGVGRGFGGPDVSDRGMISGTLVLAQPVREFARGTLVAALNASANVLWSDSYCLANPDDTGPPPCVTYPSHASAGVLAGWAMRAQQGSGVRLLVGPSYFAVDAAEKGLGLLARVDGAQPLTRRLSLVFWVQGAFPPGAGGERLSTGTGGLGVRFR